MAVNFSLNIFGEEEIARRLERFGEDLKNYRPAWSVIMTQLEEAEKGLFEAEGRGWAPLSPAYSLWKGQHFPGKSILRRTDTLYESLTGQTGNSVRVSESMQMRWGTTVEYARYHQQGRGVPQRRIVDLLESEKMAIMKTLQRYVVAMSKGAPFG